MPEIVETAQYQQSTDALAPLVADQGTWFDQSPLPPRPPAPPAVERGADAWFLSPLVAALPSVLQQLLATPPRAPAARAPIPALELRPLGQSSPVGVLGWELPGARPPPPVPRNAAGADWPLRAFTASTPLLSTLDQPPNRPPPGTPPRIGAPALELRPFTSSTPLLPGLDQPTARGPAPVPPPRPMEQAQPLGPGIILPTGWEVAVILAPPVARARMVADAFALAPLAPQLGVTGWEVPPLPPRAPAPIPRPSPLAVPPGTIIPQLVNSSWGWEPPGRVPPRVPWIPRVEQADPPGNFLFPPAASTGWEPQGAQPRSVPRVARFEVAGPVGSPVVVLAPSGWEPAFLRPPAAPRLPIPGSSLPPGALILPWGWDSGPAQGRPPGARQIAQDAVLPPLAVLLPYFAPDAGGRVLLARAPQRVEQVPGTQLVVLGPTGWEPASPPPRRPYPTMPAARFHGGADFGLLMPPPVLAVFLDVEPTLYRQRVRYPVELLIVPPSYPVLPAPALPKFPLPPPFVVQLQDEDGPADLTGLTVVCRTMPADHARAVRVESADVVDALRGIVQKAWTEQDLRGIPTGDMLVQFVTIDGAGRPRTYPGGGRYYHVEITGRTR